MPAAPLDGALLRWRRHFAVFNPPDEAVEAALAATYSADAAAPTDPALFAWLDGLAPHLAACRLRPGEALTLPATPAPETPFTDHLPLAQIARARLARTQQLWGSGLPAAALEEADAALTVSAARLQAITAILPLIAALSDEERALCAVHWLARQPTLTPAQARALLTRLDSRGQLARAAAARAFRGERAGVFSTILDRLPRTTDVETVLASISSLGMHPGEPAAPGAPAIGDLRVPLVERAATLRLYDEALAPYLAVMRPGAVFNDPARARVNERWQQTQITLLGPLYDYAANEGPATSRLIAAARHTTFCLDNPLGRLLCILTAPNWEMIAVSTLRREAHAEALRGLLAWRVLGRAATWEQMVALGVLTRAPRDPFALADTLGTLRCDHATRRLWSVFRDGRDDGGAGTPDNVGLPPDLSWRLD
jgi:hypothetical protein